MIITLIVAWIVFTLLVRVIKTTVKTAFLAAAFIVLLEAGYGISVQDILHQLSQLPQILSQLSGSN
jgi:hypothetical protein